jgi:3-dehydroquinate synthetase
MSDTNVTPQYAAKLEASLTAAGHGVVKVIIEAGEQSKNMTVLSSVLEQLAQGGLTRSDVVLTLGDGVVGDLGGYAAASYMHGVAFVQVPNSLLAQIDSSVGGKVAVDLAAGKNLAGAFYQPKAVFIDTDLLATLSTRFLHDGLAEAIKYGCIKDAALFDNIAGFANDAALLANIDDIVAICCAIKARIVEQDEFDTGLRMLLNFGHTLGHAVEQHFCYSGFYSWRGRGHRHVPAHEAHGGAGPDAYRLC